MQEKREELARKLDAAAVAHECAGDLRSKADEAQEKSSRASHTFNGDRTEKNHQQMARAMEARDEATLEVERERRTYQAAMELALREISATPGRGLGELLEALQRRAHDLQYRFGEAPKAISGRLAAEAGILRLGAATFKSGGEEPTARRLEVIRIEALGE